MRRGILITGLILVVVFGVFLWLGYIAAQSDCATDIFGNQANPGACSDDAGLIVLGLLGVVAGLILTILGGLLKSKEKKPAPSPVPQVHPGAPSGKVCLRCGAYYPEPVPAFCSKCGGPVGSSSTSAPPPSPAGR